MLGCAIGGKKMGRMPQRIAILIVASLAATLLVSCSQKETIRFRMTVEVQTPEGLRTGSSVMEISAWNNSFALNGHVRGRDFEGEAVAVNLPRDRMLVALIVSERPDYVEFPDIVLGALDPFYNNDWVESVQRIANGETPDGPQIVAQTRTARGIEMRPHSDLPKVSNYPRLVTFRNLNDPASVLRMEASNLATEFGAGHRVVNISVEKTDAPVTRILGSKLPWLRSYWNKLTLKPNPPKFSEDVLDSELRLLSAGDFSTQPPG